MNEDITKRVEGTQSSDIFKRVKEIQASMVEAGKSYFDKSDLDHLRCLIRLAVEFHDYLEHGSVEIAASISKGPFAKYVGDAQSASEDPFNRYDLEFVCGSIRSSVPSFCTLNQSYTLLEGAMDSRIEWGMTSSKESFKVHFISRFKEFVEETNFEKKCRLLLGLFKLQIVFAGISYDA